MVKRRNLLAAGGTKYDTGCQGGGPSLEGLVPSATSQMSSQTFNWRAALGGIATKGNGRGNGTVDSNLKPFYVSTTNQLGGIGSKSSMTKQGCGLNGVSKCRIINSISRCKQSVPTKNFNIEKIRQ